MTGILNIQDADIIDKFNSENLSLCLIPSGRIKLKKSEYEILKDLFLENIEVIDAPTGDYISSDDVPKFFWDFIKYAISNKINISPDSYKNLCNLLQATNINFNDDGIYNFGTGSGLINIKPYYPLTHDDKSYIFQTKTQLKSNNLINTQTHNGTIRAVVQFQTYQNKSESIAIYQHRTSPTAANYWLRLIKTSYKNIQFGMRTSTVANNSCITNIDIPFGDPHYITAQPLTLTGEWTTDQSSNITSTKLTVNYHLDATEESPIAETVNSTNSKYAAAVIDASENIGGYIYSNISSAGITWVDSFPRLYEYSCTIEDKTTLEKNQITYINYDESKSINTELLQIVS